MNEPFNPYRAPTANLDAADKPLEVERVGNGRRFATYLIDQVGIYALLFVFAYGVTMIFGQAGANMILAVNAWVLSIAFFLGYYLIFEGIWGRTPAKFILGTVVVTLDGGRPPFGKIVIRTVSRFIPFEPLSFLFGERGWHDGISDTVVVSTRG